MKNFEILTDTDSVEVLKYLLGQELTEIYVRQNIGQHSCPLPLRYPESEKDHEYETYGFYLSDTLSCNQCLLKCDNNFLYITTDWGDLQELYWCNFYVRDCKLIAQEEIRECTLFIQFGADSILDKIISIELYTYQVSEDIGQLLCDCAIKLTAQNGHSLLIANDTNMLGSSRIIMQPKYQQQFMASFSAFPRLKITQNGIENYPIPLQLHTS